MHYKKVTIAIALPALMAGLWPTTALAEFWEKAWVMSSITGSPDNKRALASIVGREIVLAPDKIVDPLANDCQSGVDLTDIRLRPVTELRRHFGSFWHWPKFRRAEVIYGWARCDGTNVGAFAFAAGDEGYLFYEGGTIINLK